MQKLIKYLQKINLQNMTGVPELEANFDDIREMKIQSKFCCYLEDKLYFQVNKK